jgi:hypothetical protein
MMVSASKDIKISEPYQQFLLAPSQPPQAPPHAHQG